MTNKFLSALKAVGKGLARVLPIASAAVPAIVTAAAGPAAGAVASSIMDRIQAAVGLSERVASMVEASKGVKMDGKEKFALAVSIANESIGPLEIVAGRDILDNEKFARGSAKLKEAVEKLVEAVADIEDSVAHPGGVGVSD